MMKKYLLILGVFVFITACGTKKITDLSGPVPVPKAIPGLSMWFDSSQIVGLNSGDAISVWYDMSGNGSHLSQSTGTLAPLYISNGVNGRPVVRSDGVDDYMETDAVLLIQPLDYFVVYKSIALGTVGDERIISGSGSGADGCAVKSVNTPSFTLYSGNASVSYTAGTVASGAFVFYEGKCAGANSEIIVTNSLLVSGDPGANNPNGLSIGGTATAATYSNVDYAEIIIYSRILEPSERTRIMNYLNSKYALY